MNHRMSQRMDQVNNHGMQHSFSVAAALAQATAQLYERSPTARLDAELLLAQTLGWSRARILADGNQILDDTALRSYWHAIARRQALEPVAYILGEREFYGLHVLVDSRVLVPRPETELLIELALAVAPPAARILDLCTGSGCIALALAHQLPLSHILATDLSPDALDVARVNIERYGLSERIELRQGDLFAAADGLFDLIICNPPYTILQQVDVGVYLHEPHLALDGGTDGLICYQRLLHDAGRFLAPAATMVLEIGAEQGPAVAALARKALPAAQVSVHTDLAGWDRAVQVRLVGEAVRPSGDTALTL